MCTTSLERRIYVAAKKELQENHGLGHSFIANYKVHPTAQKNQDGSVTYEITLIIDNIKYDIEVYEQNDKLTADCWRIQDQLTGKFILGTDRI